MWCLILKHISILLPFPPNFAVSVDVYLENWQMAFSLASLPHVKCINETKRILFLDLFRQMPMRYIFMKVLVSTSNRGIVSILGHCVSSQGLLLLCENHCDTCPE